MLSVLSFHITVSTAVYLFCGVVIGILGIRSIIRYQSLRTPLSLLYGLTGVVAAMYFFCYSVPFMVTHDPTVLKLAIIAGDFFFYAVLVIQARIVWYFTLSKKAPFAVIGVPVALLGAYAWYLYTFTITKDAITARISDPNAVFDAPLMARRIDTLLAFLFLAVAILLVRQAVAATDKLAKLRLWALSFMYGITFLITVYNTTLSRGPKDSPVSYAAFLVAFGFMLFALTRIKSGENAASPPSSPSAS